MKVEVQHLCDFAPGEVPVPGFRGQRVKNMATALRSVCWHRRHWRNLHARCRNRGCPVLEWCRCRCECLGSTMLQVLPLVQGNSSCEWPSHNSQAKMFVPRHSDGIIVGPSIPIPRDLRTMAPRRRLCSCSCTSLWMGPKPLQVRRFRMST